MSSDPRDEIFATEHLKKDLGARTGKSSILVVLFAGLKFVIRLGSTAILARLVLPAEQGVIAMVLPMILIATGLAEFGLSQALVQREQVTHRLASALFWANLGLGVLFTGLLMALAVPVARFYGDTRVGPVLLVLAPTVLLAAILVQYVSILRRQMRIGAIEKTILAATIGSLVAAIALAFAGFGYWALVAQILTQPILTLAILLGLTKWVPARPSLRALYEARAMLGFGGYLAAARVLTDIMMNLPAIIIGRIYSAAVAGTFYRSRSLASLPKDMVISALSGSFLPALSRAQNDPPVFQSIFCRSVTRMALIIMPVGLGICTSADLIVAILLGPHWTMAAPMLAWLGLDLLFAVLITPMYWALVAMGKGRTMLFLKIYTAVVVLAALVIGSRLDVIGMLALYVLSSVIFVMPVTIWLVVRNTSLSLATILRATLPDVLLLAVAYPVVMAIRAMLPEMNAFAELVLLGLLIGGIYIGWILVNPGLRADVVKVLRLVFARVRPGRAT